MTGDEFAARLERVKRTGPRLVARKMPGARGQKPEPDRR
jgi:hypothetical protein